MEQWKLGSLLFACVLLGLLSRQSTATSFKGRLEDCLIRCACSGKSIYTCGLKCAAGCILPSTSSVTSTEGTQQQFCKLGCAFSLCANISSKSNPGGEDVASCVNSCSGKCTNKNY